MPSTASRTSCMASISRGPRRGRDAARPQWRGAHDDAARRSWALSGGAAVRSGSTAARRSRSRPHRIAHLGVGYCPEERGIYLEPVDRGEPAAAAARRHRGGMSVGEIYDDVSQPRRSARIARVRGFRAASSRCSRWRASCAPGARLLLLDEISEGLAPVIVQALSQMILDAAAAAATRS